jgi:hypothetical protein
MRSAEPGGGTWTAPGANGSAVQQAALDLSPVHEPEPVVQRALETGRRASFAIGSHRGGAAASPAAPAPAPAQQPAAAAPGGAHDGEAKLSEEQLHQAYEYFESRWRDRLWVERDLLGRRVDLH